MGWWLVILKEFSILSFHIFCLFFLRLNCCISLPSTCLDPQKPMMRGSPGPPSGMRGGPGPNFANINNIHQCEIHMKPRKRKNFLQAWLNKFPSRAKKIDVLARVIFPAIFAFFNMSYWTFYLTQEANTDVK